MIQSLGDSPTGTTMECSVCIPGFTLDCRGTQESSGTGTGTAPDHKKKKEKKDVFDRYSMNNNNILTL